MLGADQAYEGLYGGGSPNVPNNGGRMFQQGIPYRLNCDPANLQIKLTFTSFTTNKLGTNMEIFILLLLLLALIGNFELFLGSCLDQAAKVKKQYSPNDS